LEDKKITLSDLVGRQTMVNKTTTICDAVVTMVCIRQFVSDSRAAWTAMNERWTLNHHWLPVK